MYFMCGESEMKLNFISSKEPIKCLGNLNLKLQRKKKKSIKEDLFCQHTLFYTENKIERRVIDFRISQLMHNCNGILKLQSIYLIHLLLQNTRFDCNTIEQMC